MSRTTRLLTLLQALRGKKRPVTAAVLAAQLEVSERTLYRDIASGRLPKPTKVGRSSRWRFSDIELYRGGTSSNQERV